MRGWMALALLAVALSGCATAPTPMTWAFSADRQEGAKLALGVPDTDDVLLVAVCEPQSGEISLTIVGRPNDAAVLELHSGKIWQRYAGAGIGGGDSIVGAMDIQFHLRADDPVLAQVADTGELTLVLGARRQILPNGFASEHDFITACRARP
ncbi:hypothetical protein [Phenylobacterium sp.]|uniref:hypothetical protein n=1 Tax=Phenylobacterium sp. TaxID=1871053 RepID=UPI0012199804|nr:hypothetical protein [Phenylobacterium sp.]THD62243.1 MAG: hypothetical protein E8A49_08220 [Phenylobacterium sp.]